MPEGRIGHGSSRHAAPIEMPAARLRTLFPPSACSAHAFPPRLRRRRCVLVRVEARACPADRRIVRTARGLAQRVHRRCGLRRRRDRVLRSLQRRQGRGVQRRLRGPASADGLRWHRVYEARLRRSPREVRSRHVHRHDRSAVISEPRARAAMPSSCRRGRCHRATRRAAVRASIPRRGSTSSAGEHRR
jgi:hypothetical protein